VESLTLEKASILWEYMSAMATHIKSDAIVVCCSYDLRVCDHACELMDAGYSDILVLSGNAGNWTRDIWDEPEAKIFFDRAVNNGINPDQILMEPEATNLGENISFSKALIPEAKTVTFVSKPNSLLRVKLTAEAQWPEVTSHLSCPAINFPRDVSKMIGVPGVINEMVGDIERIQKYSGLGFQAPHLIPDEVINSWEYLIKRGFTGRLMPDHRDWVGS
jgi:uncharacterized SAM-binding protein YcdF (DUF218 family)